MNTIKWLLYGRWVFKSYINSDYVPKQSIKDLLKNMRTIHNYAEIETTYPAMDRINILKKRVKEIENETKM